MNRLVVWGGRDSLDSIRHPWRTYHRAALKTGLDSVWIDDIDPLAPDYLRPGDTVLAADVTGRHLPYLPGVDYILHNYPGDHELCQALEATPERLLRLQVWTTDATGEVWDTCRQFDLSARTLFQPWGSDLLPDEFLEPVFNPASTEVSFVGAVWSDQYQGVELGNEATIAELRSACMVRGLRLVHQTQISDLAMVEATRAARLAPAFAGGWQVAHGYLPCRYFKAAAYGTLAFGNVAEADALLGVMTFGGSLSIAERLDCALLLTESEYVGLVREQQKVVARYTYRQSIESIERAFAEIRA